MDVAILDANHYGIDSSELLTRRKAVQRKLQKLINSDQRNNLAKQLASLESVVSAISPTLLNTACYKLGLFLNKQLKRCIHGQISLHQLRITLKKVRYALEAMGRPATPIKHLQDILGDAHDLEILQKLTGKNKNGATGAE